MDCDDLGTTAVPRTFGTDNPPPPAYIRKTKPTGDDKYVDKCNKALWVRYDDDGTVEVNGSTPTASNWPERIDDYHALLLKAASKYIVPAAWIAGFIAQESRGIPPAVSSAGAVGLMQIMPGTAKWLSDPAFPGKTPGHEGPTRDELSDPSVNIDLGTKFLAHLMTIYNDNIVHVAAAYNHGSAECGDQVPVGSESCPTPANEWGLITNCGYVDGIINFTNRAVREGYSGRKEINLDTDVVEPTTEEGHSVASILLGLGIGVAAVVGARRFWK